ncbi:MAG: hypothetical protein IIV99_06220 [Oscillospiraceae bacterium]|nr:hypothetical protein [Oscillospiraceae bacterium]
MDRKEYAALSWKRKEIEKKYLKIRKILMLMAEIFFIAGWFVFAVSHNELKKTYIYIILILILSIYLFFTDNDWVKTDWKYAFFNSLWMHMVLIVLTYMKYNKLVFLLIFEVVPYYYFFNKYYRQYKSEIDKDK